MAFFFPSGNWFESWCVTHNFLICKVVPRDLESDRSGFYLSDRTLPNPQKHPYFLHLWSEIHTLPGSGPRTIVWTTLSPVPGPQKASREGIVHSFRKWYYCPIPALSWAPGIWCQKEQSLFLLSRILELVWGYQINNSTISNNWKVW